MGSGVGLMLVHGGGHDARCWQRLLPHLAGPNLVIDLPGRGVRPADLSRLTTADFVNSAVADLDAFHAAERVVLVGHSMAGITIPQIAVRRPDRVAHLVFVSCFVPREGAAIIDEMPPWTRLLVTWLSQRRPLRPMSPSIAKRIFCNDMDAQQTRFALSCLVPEAPQTITERISRVALPGIDVIPRTYIKLLRDRSLRPVQQDRFIKNIGDCRVRSIDCGHNAMISRPEQLAAALNEVRA